MFTGVMETPAAPAQSVCSECEYNTPHHQRGCSAALTTVALCPEHATGTPVGSDDGQFRCLTCDAHGYHVRLFVAPNESSAR